MISKSSALIALSSAFGLAWIAVAFFTSRAQLPVAQYPFWIGMICLILPAILRLSSRETSRIDRLRLLLILAITLSLVKVFYSPVYFTFFDELQHWRTTDDMLQNGRLFNENPILSVSPYFPGLEIVTHALISLGGLSIFQAGIILIIFSRILLVLALFLFYELIGGSHRQAGVAALIYLGNPHFLLFDAQFGYESFAIPLALFTLYATARLERAQLNQRMWLWLVAILGVCAVISTHHITSYLLVALFFLWAGIAWIRRKGPVQSWSTPFWMGVAGIVGIVLWLVFVANRSLDYLTPPMTSAIREMIQLILGERSPRQLFTSSAAESELLGFLRIMGITSILLILLSLPFGLLKTWKNYKHDYAALALGLIAATYPVTLALRYVPWGLTVASRTAPYVFVGISFVLATGYKYLHWPEQKRHLAFAVWALVVFLGITASNLSAWGLPRNYVVDSYTNSVDNPSFSAARWVYSTLGSSNRFAAEDPMLWVLGSYGRQRSVTPDMDKIWFNYIFDTSGIDGEKLRIIERAGVRYLAIDRRRGSPILTHVSTVRVRIGQRVEMKKIDIPSPQSEFDRLSNASRILDNGSIVIYEFRGLQNEE